MRCCIKPVHWGLILIAAVLGIGAICILVGKETTDGGGDASESIGEYESIEDYLVQQAEENKTESLAVWEKPLAVMAAEPVEVSIIDRKLDFLEHHKEWDESNSNSVLETWSYNWLIKPDPNEIDLNTIVYTGRGMDGDGYICQTSNRFVLAQHYSDDSYDVLAEVSILEMSDYLAQRSDGEGSIYDYVRTQSR